MSQERNRFIRGNGKMLSKIDTKNPKDIQIYNTDKFLTNQFKFRNLQMTNKFVELYCKIDKKLQGKIK